MKKNRIIQDFKNEDEERAFWSNHSPLDYFDVKDSKSASFPKLKPSVKEENKSNSRDFSRSPDSTY